MSDDNAPEAESTDTPVEQPVETPGASEQPKTFDEDYVKKLRDEAAKYRTEAKANAKRLEELEKQSMTETEKAIAEAKNAARAEVLGEVGSKLVDAEVRAAAAGRNVDVDALLEGLDRRRFITEDGEANRDDIVKWVDRIAPKGDERPSPIDMGQGTRPNNNPGQLDEAAIKNMTPKQIQAALKEGRLDNLLTGR